MRIFYDCKDGSSTIAATFSIALEYWLMRHLPKFPLPENPKPL